MMARKKRVEVKRTEAYIQYREVYGHGKYQANMYTGRLCNDFKDVGGNQQTLEESQIS